MNGLNEETDASEDYFYANRRNLWPVAMDGTGYPDKAHAGSPGDGGEKRNNSYFRDAGLFSLAEARANLCRSWGGPPTGKPDAGDPHV